VSSTYGDVARAAFAAAADECPASTTFDGHPVYCDRGFDHSGGRKASKGNPCVMGNAHRGYSEEHNRNVTWSQPLT
jgi:hypothetical protein